ncbi:hypothetical protein [Hymenobacter nivis]|uniref:hypothetical protein n=1 Tax=Hymenobacter nivis TaxID=1850093 RepID=UPI0013A55B34|nr:hypothetical protein [Hymenobacter nivis]
MAELPPLLNALASVSDYNTFGKPSRLAAFTGAGKCGNMLAVASPAKLVVGLELE